MPGKRTGGASCPLTRHRYPVPAALQKHIYRHAAVFQPGQLMNAFKRLWNARTEFQRIRRQTDAEQSLVKTAQHAGNTPELAIRTEQQPLIQPRFQKDIFLVRAAQQGGTDQATASARADSFSTAAAACA